MRSIRYFIDVWCLFATRYTGVQNVNYQIVKYFYENLHDRTVFFYEQSTLHEAAIQSILYNRSGKELTALNERNYLVHQKLHPYLDAEAEQRVGIFPCVKDLHRVFEYETQIIYDITFLLTPEFHNTENIHLHASRIEKSLETNDLNVCISESTREDIVTYLNVPEEKTLVVHPACESGWERRKSRRIQRLHNRPVEPFLLILGTIEPRKNINLVLKYLEQHPETLTRYRFIFIGDDGWGHLFKDHLDALHLPEAMKRERIRHLSYVTEEEKNILLMAARFTIFPSIYEGFGLPVLEAMSFGCPVLASMSSSIPEIGEDLVYYFDPYSLKSFADAFNALEHLLSKENDQIREKCRQRASQFTWSRFAEKIIERVNTDVRKGINGGI
jgi:glycosyltransferase involved in cell wall biosynthesis